MKKLTKAIFVATLALAGMWTCSGASRDSVRFTLTIEDCEVPDMTAYRALSLCGKAFDYEKSRNGEDVLYRWFARALLVNDLPMVLTYRGYAQWLQMGMHEISSSSNLESRATEHVLAKQAKERERKLEGVSRSHLIGVISGGLPNGMPYPWKLPKVKGMCDSKVVWDAAYWDLVGTLGTKEEKRQIMSVDAEYDKGERFDCGGRVPSFGFSEFKTGFRLAFQDGIGGTVFARLHIEYPGSFWSHNWYAGHKLAEYYCHDPIIRFVFGELKKPENRGRTITGTFKWKTPVGCVYVDGQKAPMLSVEADGVIRNGESDIVNLSKAEVVPDAAYAKQEQLEWVRFSASLKKMGTRAFAECGMLGYGHGALKLPAGLEVVGDGAFAGCHDLSGIELPNSVTNLGVWAFAECSALRSAVLPSGLTDIPDGLFYQNERDWRNQHGLQRVKIPNGVKRIGRYAFASNNLLTEVEFPEGMEEIGDYAFYGCSELTNVVVHGGLKRIGEAAFMKCGKLQRPNLPPSVEIGDWAFGQAPAEKRE